MKKINDLKELGFDTTKLCVNAPYILKKEGHTYICSVVSVSDRTISVSYFTKDYTLAIELLHQQWISSCQSSVEILTLITSWKENNHERTHKGRLSQKHAT